MPREKFLQEYEASPMSFVGAVFDGELINLSAQRGADMLVTPRGRSVEAGLDWGWHVTAFEVCTETADDRIVWFYEHVFEHVELNRRCQEIARLCKELDVEVIYADAAGATENVTLAVAFEKAGVRTEIQPVPFNIYKDVGIQTRRYFLENMLENVRPHCSGLIADSKRYHYDATGEKPAKGDDHTVDAATAFYASRAGVLQGIVARAVADTEGTAA
jgi:protoporphyrinogen oxidase